MADQKRRPSAGKHSCVRLRFCLVEIYIDTLPSIEYKSEWQRGRLYVLLACKRSKMNLARDPAAVAVIRNHAGRGVLRHRLGKHTC